MSSTTRRIDAKRQELDRLRHSIRQTLGPRHTHGVGLGLALTGFSLGVMAERWGLRPLLSKMLALNKFTGIVTP